jgi:hypothetical protein
MKFNLRYLLLEIALIGRFLAVCRYKPMWREHFYLHIAELVIVGIALLVSLSAAVGGLFLRPWRGAIIGLILSVILIPMMVLGTLR